VIVEASLAWVTVFRSRGRLTSSGSGKLYGADCAATAPATVVAVVAVVGAGAAFAAGFASDFEQADRATARTATAAQPRWIPMLLLPN
jgi:hypothetical protein